MLTLRDVTLRRGIRELYAHASFSVHAGERVAIVGPNGSGKTSLFALITGQLSPDAGDVSVQTGHVLATVAQEAAVDDRPAVEVVLDGDRELRHVEQALKDAETRGDGEKAGHLHARLESIGGYAARSRAARLLHGLGFEAAAIERPADQFSGGWQRRLLLAQALMARSDILLLDEPTNHLDLDAVLWLETWLRAYPGTLLVIAHDREFLDRVATRVVSIEAGRVETYAGGYSDFEARRAERLAQQQAAHDRQQRKVREIMGFVARFRAQATKARQAQSRLKMLERMERIAPAHVDSPFEFVFATPDRLPRPLLALDGIAAGYPGKCVLEGVEMSLSPGDRIGLLGRNGAGKSTLTRILAGVDAPLAGRRTSAQDVSIGYFAQHQLEQLDPLSTPLQHLQRRGGAALAAATEEEQRNFLGGFGFSGDRVFEPVAPFSGGEKARLVLALVVSHRPNLLLLDEPTNHLDLEMRHALGMALQDFAGAIVLVSHDRYLLKMVADQLWLVHDGCAAPFEGDLDDYAKFLQRPLEESGGQERPTATRGAAQERERKRVEAERRRELAPLRAVVNKAERDIATLTPRLDAIETQLADSALYDSARKTDLTALLAEQAEIRRRLDDAEVAWLEASEQLEAAAMASRILDT
jgi:ATP-binding cassette, subfamily F, member 3